MQFITMTGPFGLFASALGILLLVANAATWRRDDRRVFPALAAGIAAVFLVGTAGTGIGMYVAATSIEGADVSPEQAALLWRRGLAVATTSTSLAAAWAAVNALAVGIRAAVK